MCQAKVEARAIADNWKDFNAKYIYEQIEKWRLVRKEARAKHDDTSIAISICYINAFQQILNKHNATRNPQEYAA